LNSIFPVTRAFGGSSRSSASAIVDFPEPLSPTSPTLAPRGISSETSSTAETTPRSVR
jgi:hypothetical protein